MLAYKLFRIRKDGTLDEQRTNRRQRIPLGKPLVAESHRTKGYKYRPGWHVVDTPNAPHLSTVGRKWYVVNISGWTKHVRPASQGGLWYTAKTMTVLRPVDL